MTEKVTTLFSEADLLILFPNEVQRLVFKKCMSRLIEIINERSVKVPFAMLQCERI